MPCTAHLLMIKPVHFGYNPETALNNTFQKKLPGNLQEKALEEFTGLASELMKNQVDVTIVQDTEEPFTPDAIFPNNWVSFDEDGQVFLYPMYAENRRKERKQHVLDAIGSKFRVEKINDLSEYENEGFYLEGTGSMVLDRDNRIAYANISERTHLSLLREYCRLTGYKAMAFHASDSRGKSIYHTNVMMCVGDSIAVVCSRSVTNPDEKAMLLHTLKGSGKEIVELSMEQLRCFAGNMLQVRSLQGEDLLVMSSGAHASLDREQLASLQKYCRLIHTPLHTIETAGGGSARCMLAEIFLQKK